MPLNTLIPSREYQDVEKAAAMELANINMAAAQMPPRLPNQ